MNRRNFSLEDQRRKYDEADAILWARYMIEDPYVEGTILLTKGPGIQIKMCHGIVIYEEEEHPCVLILSQRPQRIPTLLWNEFHQKFGNESEARELFSVEIVDLRDRVPVVQILEGFPWRWVRYEDVDESPL